MYQPDLKVQMIFTELGCMVRAASQKIKPVVLKL